MTLIPTQVTFRGLAHDEALEVDVRERVSWLEQFYTGIVRCRALHEAFDTARRRLEGFAREQRSYFNRASVLDAAFDDLTVGTPVAFPASHLPPGRC